MRCPICDVVLETTELQDDICRTCNDVVKRTVSYYDAEHDEHILVEENDEPV